MYVVMRTGMTECRTREEPIMELRTGFMELTGPASGIGSALAL